MILSKNMYFTMQIKKNVKSLKANLLNISIILIILVYCLPIIITRNIQALPATLRIFLLAWKSCLNQLQKSYLLICLQHFSTCRDTGLFLNLHQDMQSEVGRIWLHSCPNTKSEVYFDHNFMPYDRLITHCGDSSTFTKIEIQTNFYCLYAHFIYILFKYI